MRRIWFMLLAFGALSSTARALPFEPGEQLTFGITFMHMNIGSVEVTVNEDVQSNLRVWPIHMTGKTTGFFNRLHPIDDSVISTFDPSMMRSLGTVFERHERKHEATETVRIEGNSAFIHRVTPSGTTDQITPIAPDAQDLLSGIYFLRAQNLDTTKEIRVPVFTGWHNWDLVARVDGHERVKTDAGSFDTIVVRCKTYFSGNFSSEKEMTLWLSNDDRHLLVKMQADFMMGSVRAELKSYRHGPLAQR